MTTRALPRILCVLALALAWLAEITTASAQTSSFGTERSLNDRVNELEGTIKQLQATIQAPAAKPVDAPPLGLDKAQTPFLAGWDKGFILRSPDDRFQLKITGQIQSDYHTYMDQKDTADLPTFLLRRARLGIEATVAKYYEFRMLPDFGLGQARIVDSYVNVHYWDEFQFETGKFKQPFSQGNSSWIDTCRRSNDRDRPAGPARDVGAMIHGQKLFGDRFGMVCRLRRRAKR